jgi:hypothetical protein
MNPQSDSHLIPPRADVDWALEVERLVSDAHRELYLECLNGEPMSRRMAPRSLRDGCILTGIFLRCLPDLARSNYPRGS